MLELSWLLPLAILFQEMSALKERIQGNKKGQVPGTSKERKSETRGKKVDKCPTVELGVQDTHLRGKKRIYRASHSSQKASNCKKGMYPFKRAKIELDFHHCYHHHHHIIFTRHTCTS